MDEKVLELIELARDKSQDARSSLVENITDLFLSDSGRLNDHERALMSDILCKLISTIEASLKKELSDTLAKADIQLPDVAKILANDDIEIARPLLEKSPLLKDQDLIEIIRMRTDEYRLAISIRDGLSPEVSDSLIEYGSQDVIESLLKNHDASISKRAMELIVAESKRVDRFQEPLLGREDLPSELAHKMYWWVSAALRKKIMTDFKIDQIKLDSAIQKATHQALNTYEGQPSAIQKAQKLVRRMHESEELTYNFLLQSLRQQKISVFVAGIGELANISYPVAWQIFNDKNGESLAIISKAIGLSRPDFTSMFLLISKARDGDQAKSPGALKGILKLFDDVTEDSAAGAIQFWQQNKDFQSAVEVFENVGK